MIIKYRCWDFKHRVFRHPNPDNMVSVFVKDKQNGMRIVQPAGYEFTIWTGFEDKNGCDIYAGDKLDDKYYVKWDVLAGGWGLYTDREAQSKPVRFDSYPAYQSEVTGNIYEE